MPDEGNSLAFAAFGTLFGIGIGVWRRVLGFKVAYTGNGAASFKVPVPFRPSKFLITSQRGTDVFYVEPGGLVVEGIFAGPLSPLSNYAGDNYIDVGAIGSNVNIQGNVNDPGVSYAVVTF